MTDKNRFSRRSYLKAGAVAGIGALAGCSGGGSSGGGDDTESGSESGSESGGGSEGTTMGSPTESMASEVVYYGSADRPDFFDAFEEETGITVNSVTAPGYQAVSRFQTEESNDQHSADVLQSVSQVFLRDQLTPYFAEIDLWEEYKDVFPSSLVEQVEDVATDEEISKMLPVSNNNYVAAYSSSRVDEPIESWDGLLRSSLEGKIGAPTFTMSSMYWILRREMSEGEADQYFKDLAAQDTRFAGQATSSFTESIVAGQADAAFGIVGSTALAPFVADGAPVAPVTADWSGTAIEPIAVSKNAPHPQAARELVRFMISEKGQKANATGGAGAPSVRKDVEHGNDQLREVYSNMTLYPMFITPDTKDRIIGKANELLPLS